MADRNGSTCFVLWQAGLCLMLVWHRPEPRTPNCALMPCGKCMASSSRLCPSPWPWKRSSTPGKSSKIMGICLDESRVAARLFVRWRPPYASREVRTMRASRGCGTLSAPCLRDQACVTWLKAAGEWPRKGLPFAMLVEILGEAACTGSPRGRSGARRRR